MSRVLSLVIFGVLAIAGCNNANSSGLSVPTSVSAAIARIESKPAYAHSRWGIVVEDVSTGKRLVDRDSQKMFVPGSIMKTYSTTAVLKAYGPDYRFHTPVYAMGARERGVLRGNLILVASGDFSFGLREQRNGKLAFNSFPEIDHNYADTGLPGPVILRGSEPLSGLNDLARQIRASGIRRLDGNVVIDDRLFHTYRGWPDGIIAPIWINENVVDITATPSTTGRPAVVDWRPKAAGFRIAANVTTVATKEQAQPLRVQSGAVGIVRVSGAVAAGAAPSLTIWQIPNPSSYARTAFIEALQRAGIAVAANKSGANPTQLLPIASDYRTAQKVAERISPPLSEFVKVILKTSYNRGADLVVCLVAVKNGSRDCTDGLMAELKTIASLGVSPESTLVYDGAGSVDSGRTSPADQAALLRTIVRSRWGKVVHDGMALMGVDGTQAENLAGTPLAGHIRVKDGSRINGSPDGQVAITAKTEVGYIDAKSGRHLVYAVFLNDISAGPKDTMQTFFGADRDLAGIAAAIQQGY